MEKLKINNLPHWISEIHLKQFFHSCGKIVHVSVAIDQQTRRHLGYGYLVFADAPATEKALQKDGASLDGVVIQVTIEVDAVPS